jgi:hypothetical protein
MKYAKKQATTTSKTIAHRRPHDICNDKTPTITLTAYNILNNINTIIHTSKDNIDKIDLTF